MFGAKASLECTGDMTLKNVLDLCVLLSNQIKMTKKTFRILIKTSHLHIKQTYIFILTSINPLFSFLAINVDQMRPEERMFLRCKTLKVFGFMLNSNDTAIPAGTA